MEGKNYRFRFHRTRLHRPALTRATKSIVKPYKVDRNHRILDPNTKKYTYKVDIGHKRGYENHSMMRAAERVGMDQKSFGRMMNNPDFYQLEDRSANRSHRYEEKDPNVQRRIAFQEIRKFYGMQPRLAERKQQKSSQSAAQTQKMQNSAKQSPAQKHTRGCSH